MPVCCDEWQQRRLADFTHWKNCIHFLLFQCCDSFPLYCSLPRLVMPVHCIVFLPILILYYSLFFASVPVYLFFLFLPALPPLCCQHFTVDIQLLAGHSIVIPFRATPFSAGPQTAIQITSPAAFRVAALQNVVFKHFWGHHLIWSPKHNWMSVVT